MFRNSIRRVYGLVASVLQSTLAVLALTGLASLGAAMPQANPPASLTEYCSDCPPALSIMYMGVEGLAGLPPCTSPVQAGCLTDPTTPSLADLAEEWEDEAGDAGGNGTGCMYICWSEFGVRSITVNQSPPNTSCYGSQPGCYGPFTVPWIDADGDGNHYLTDEDENKTPFPPSSEEARFNDNDGDGVPNGLDASPDDAKKPTGLVPPALLGAASPEVFKAFFKFEYGVDFPDDVSIPDFVDTSGDGYLSANEVAHQMALHLTAQFNAAGANNDKDRMLALQEALAACAIADPSLLVRVETWGKAIDKLVDTVSKEVDDPANPGSLSSTPIGSAATNHASATANAGTIALHPDGSTGVFITAYEEGAPLQLPGVGYPQPQSGSANQSTTGDPVDTARGEFLYSTVDFHAEGRGIDFSIARHYRSRDMRNGLVGPNWSIPVLETHMLIYKSLGGGNALNVFWGDGSRSVLESTPHSGGQGVLWVGVNGCYAKAQHTPSNYNTEECAEPPEGDLLRTSIVLRQPDGMQYYFCPPSGMIGTANVLVCYLRKIVDPYGNAITIRRDAGGKPYEIIDTLGRAVTFQYDPESAKLISFTDWTGQQTDYSYDAVTGDLVLVEYPEDKHLSASGAVEVRRSYEYYEYDQDPLGFEHAGDPILNHNLRWVQREDAGPQVEVTYYKDPGYEYDRVHTLLDAGGVTTFTYVGPDDLVQDPYGQSVTHMTRAVYPDGDSEAFFHERGLLLRHERYNARFSPQGAPVGPPTEPGAPGTWLTLYKYNAEMQLLETLRTTSDSYPGGRRTVLTYDSANSDRFQQRNLLRMDVHPDSVLDPSGAPQVHEYIYEPVTGQPLFTTDSMGRVTTHFYGHQELDYPDIRDHPLVRDWDILPATPEHPWMWGYGDLNQDGQTGFGLISQALPHVEVADASGPGGYVSQENPTVTLKYNEFGQVVETIDPEGTRHVITYSGGLVRQRTSDPGGLSVGVTLGRDAYGRVLHKRKPNGATDHFAYNPKGQVVWSMSREACPGHGPLACIFHHGIWEEYYYDEAGRLAGCRSPYYSDSIPGMAAGSSPLIDLRMRYDSSGNLTSAERRKWQSGAVTAEGVWSRTFDGRGRLAESISPAGLQEVSVRSARGLPSQVEVTDPVDGRQGQWLLEYNAYDELIKQIGPASVGSPETLIHRDGFGRIVALTHPDGSETEITYDGGGRITRNLSRQGGSVKADVAFEYDAIDRQTRVVIKNLIEDHQGIVVSGSPVQFEVRFGYGAHPARTLWKANACDQGYDIERYEQDALLRLTGVFRGVGEELGVRYALDAMGYPVSMTEYKDGRGVSGAVSPSWTTTDYEYDEHARLIRETDPSGGQTLFEYSPQGNLTRKTDPMGMVWSSEYDSLGGLTSTTQLNNGQARTWTFLRDIEGGVLEITGPEGRIVSYERNAAGLVLAHQAGVVRTDIQYDAVGRVLVEVNPQGGARVYQYDILGRPVSITSTGEGPSVQQSLVWNSSGQAVQITDAVDGQIPLVTRRKHNARGQLLVDQQTAGVGSGAVVAAYDGRGALRSLGLPFAHSIAFGYDSHARLASIVSSRVGSLLSVTAPYGATQLRRADLTCSEALVREYDPSGRVTLLEARSPSGSLLAGETYAYDLAGRLLERTSLHEPRRQEISYDLLGRVGEWLMRDTQSQAVLREVGFTWDREDNVLRRTDSLLGVSTASYDASNRLGSLQPLWNTLTYDSEGAEKTRVSSLGEDRVWTHDALGRPVQCVIDQPGEPSVTVAWVHDGFGRMVERYQDGVLDEAYRYFGNDMVSIRKGGVWSDMIPAGQGGATLCFVDGQGEVSYLFTDPMGNVVGEFACDTLSSWRPLDPFGVAVNSDGTSPSAVAQHGVLGFQGMPYDGLLDAYRLGRRLFDPMAARFLSRDPLNEIDSSNAYQYGFGDPYRWRDPLGLSGTATQSPDESGENIRDGGPNFLWGVWRFIKEHYEGLGWDRPRIPRGPWELARVLRLMLEVNNYYLNAYAKAHVGEALTDEEGAAIKGMDDNDRAGLVVMNRNATGVLMVAEAPQVAAEMAEEALSWVLFGGVTRWASKGIAFAWKYVKPVGGRVARGVGDGAKRLVKRLFGGAGNAKGLAQPSVVDAKLGNLVDDLYKGSKAANPIGTGSTADAIRHELATGKPVGGRYHSQKGAEYARALEKWLVKNPGASASDRSAAQALLHDLRSALGGK